MSKVTSRDYQKTLAQREQLQWTHQLSLEALQKARANDKLLLADKLTTFIQELEERILHVEAQLWWQGRA